MIGSFDSPSRTWTSAPPLATWNGYEVHKCSRSLTKLFIREHHYTKCGGGGFINFGLFKDNVLVGATCWNPPVLNVTKMFDNPLAVLALSRLVIAGDRPKNLASWFLTTCTKALPSRWESLITWADPHEGHKGTVYKAAGWEYIGMTRAQEQHKVGEALVSSAHLPKAALRAIGAVGIGKRSRLTFALRRSGQPLPLTTSFAHNTLSLWLATQSMPPLVARAARALGHRASEALAQTEKDL